MSEVPLTSGSHGAQDGRATSLETFSGNVTVGMTEGRGRGLFASVAMKKGATILIERPLVAMQSLDNVQDVMVCRNCLGFAGDLISQLELLSGVPRRECLLRHEKRHQNNIEGSPELRGVFSGLHECLAGCGELYCSPECRSDHFERCHGLLCVGPVPEEEAHTHPLVAFRVHAMETNEIFLLVGEVMAQIVKAFLSSTNSNTAADDDRLGAAKAPFVDFVQEPWWNVAVQREQPSPTGDGDADHKAAASLPDTLRTLCEESSALLRCAFGPFPPALEKALTAERFGRIVGMFEQNNVGVRRPSPITAALKKLVDGAAGCEPGFLSEVAALVSEIEEANAEEESESDDESEEESDVERARRGPSGGSCRVEANDTHDGRSPRGGCVGEEKCCIGRAADTTAEASLESSRNPGRIADAEATENSMAILRSIAGSDLNDVLFAPLDGTALYSLVCCMNHSCRPNCAVQYPARRNRQGVAGTADSLVAKVVLLKDVTPGEELTQSYVNVEMDVVERRKALEDYGFLCTCARCVEEENLQPVGKDGVVAEMGRETCCSKPEGMCR